MLKKGVYVFYEERIIRIEKAIKQVENEECISDYEVRKQIQK